MAITIDIDDREVIAALKRLRERAGAAGLKPALALIGERLAETTKQRFVSSTGPDGKPWAANKPATLARKDGARPLIDSGQLAHTIRWQFIPGGVAVGTDRFANEWKGGAAVHQFGSRDGRIKPRPFLGLSTDDREGILKIIAAHLAAD